MGYCVKYFDGYVLVARPKLVLTEFGIHYRLKSCEAGNKQNAFLVSVAGALQTLNLDNLYVIPQKILFCLFSS